MGNSNENKNYKTIKNIGEGNFYKIFLIQKDGKYYALKKIQKSKLSDSKIKTLSGMINTLKKNDSKYIIKYYNTSMEKNYFNIMMEYGGNSDLKKFIQKYKDKKQLIEERTLQKIIEKICLGVKDFHKDNIVHRNLNPENIFIDKNYNVKIGDFDVSKILINKKGAKTSVGKNHYNAPEIEKGKESNYKVDIYALGCIIYELFTLNEYYLDKVINKKDGKIKLTKYNPKWQELIDSLLKKEYQKRPNIDETLNKVMKINKVINVVFKDTNNNKMLNIVCDIDMAKEEMINKYLTKAGKVNEKNGLVFLYNNENLNKAEYLNKKIDEIFLNSDMIEIIIHQTNIIN